MDATMKTSARNGNAVSLRPASDPIAAEAEASPSFRAWAAAGAPRAERIVAFERWVYAEMAERLVWPAEPRERERMIGQCRQFVLAAAAELGERGYLFRPRELAALLREKLDEIGRLQRQGKVGNLYPYFRAIWQGWVGRNAEELRDKARLCGSHIDQVAARLLRGTGDGGRERSIVEELAAARRARRQSRPGCHRSTEPLPLFAWSDKEAGA